MVEEIFKDTIKRYGLVKKKDRLILGISGGPDSICLLNLFVRLRESYHLRLVCAHFNHGLRSAADKESEFVKKVCQNLKVRFLHTKKDVGKFLTGDSLEQTARNLRFDFFLTCYRQTKIKKVVLAHHRDDLVETVLMRLVRGTGLRGLRGFLPQTKFKKLIVIRPLIAVNKAQIMAWLKKEGLAYCVDESNTEDKFLRNRIRLKLIPFLRNLNPSIEEGLYNMARSVSLDYAFIHAFAYDKFQSLKREKTKDALRLDLNKLKDLPLPLFNNVLRAAIGELKGDTRRIERRHMEEIEALVFHRPRGSIVDLPGLMLKKEESCLSLCAARS